MSHLATVAEAVKDELNGAPGGTFSQGFTAERAYVPQVNIDSGQADELRVLVVGRSQEITVVARRLTQFDVRVEIAVIRRLTTSDLAELDGLLDFVQELLLYLRGRELTGIENARWVGIENPQAYAANQLTENRCFLSVIATTYRVIVPGQED